MFWNTLVLVTTLTGFAGVALVVGKRWTEAVMIRFDRLERELEATGDDLAEATTLLRNRLAALQGSLDELEDKADRRSIGARQLLEKQSSKIVASTRKSVAKDLATTFTQLESLRNLYAIAPPHHPVPASRNWAASPDLLLLLVSLVEARRPALIVECGSGLSTLWFATALRRYQVDGRVVALEHHAEFAERTRAVLRTHQLDRYVEVRDAPLVDFRLGDSDFAWYDQPAWSDLRDIALLFVDGPPTDTGALARYPALPLLSSRLGRHATVVLDDMIRPEEQQTLQRWLQEDSDFDVEHARLEKKAAILTRPKRPGESGHRSEPSNSELPENPSNQA